MREDRIYFQPYFLCRQKKLQRISKGQTRGIAPCGLRGGEGSGPRPGKRRSLYYTITLTLECRQAPKEPSIRKAPGDGKRGNGSSFKLFRSLASRPQHVSTVIDASQIPMERIPGWTDLGHCQQPHTLTQLLSRISFKERLRKEELGECPYNRSVRLPHDKDKGALIFHFFVLLLNTRLHGRADGITHVLSFSHRVSIRADVSLQNMHACGCRLQIAFFSLFCGLHLSHTSPKSDEPGLSATHLPVSLPCRNAMWSLKFGFTVLVILLGIITLARSFINPVSTDHWCSCPKSRDATSSSAAPMARSKALAPATGIHTSSHAAPAKGKGNLSMIATRHSGTACMPQHNARRIALTTVSGQKRAFRPSCTVSLLLIQSFAFFSSSSPDPHVLCLRFVPSLSSTILFFLLISLLSALRLVLCFALAQCCLVISSTFVSRLKGLPCNSDSIFWFLFFKLPLIHIYCVSGWFFASRSLSVVL
ncbi:hypothetical protein VP01_2376g1 [Puccinia sorghi]|uniref:Uncharacterized protein n=1 Tax=Puccinia sorghi TaxID=27349 RepID=A0A0L6V7Q4_9BASI|nr:hypothetical protein VP01_2376g1 [Puccinia sorghi]